MRANLVTAAVEGCLLGFRSGYAGTCRAKHDAKVSSQSRFSHRPKALRPRSHRVLKCTRHRCAVSNRPRPCENNGWQEYVAMDQPLPARGVPLWKQARATHFTSLHCVLCFLCSMFVFNCVSKNRG